MNRCGYVMGLMAFLLLSAAVGGTADLPVGTVSNLVVATATVEKIDLSTREVTLKGEEGEPPITIVIGPDVRNLDQIRIGDRVTFYAFRRVGDLCRAPRRGSFDYRNA